MRKRYQFSFFLICSQIISLFIVYRLGADTLAEFACRSGNSRALRFASICCPGDASVFYRIAFESHYSLAGRDINRAIVFYKKALVKNPFYADAWYQLAQASQSVGQKAFAARAIRNYEILGRSSCEDIWRAAVFHLIDGGRISGAPAAADDRPGLFDSRFDSVYAYARQCFGIGPESRDRVYGFFLLTGAPEDRVIKALPRTKEAYSEYMQYLIKRGGTDEALAFWRQADHRLIGEDAANALCRTLLADAQPETALGIWRQLPGGGQGENPADGSAVIVNGGFGEDIKGRACFGWTAAAGPGVDFSYSRGPNAGGRSLLIRSDGREGSYLRLWQPVIVAPGHSYELAAEIKTENIVTAGGIYLGVSGPGCGRFFLASGEVRGTNPWQTLSLDFRVPRGCWLIDVSLARNEPLKLDPKEPSAIWVDKVRIHDLAASRVAAGRPTGGGLPGG